MSGRKSVTEGILDEVREERMNQDDRWGEQNHRSLYDENARRNYGQLQARWKRMNDQRVLTENISWDGILLEEVYEALSESDEALIREELVQVAAVAVAWIAAIDRRADDERDALHKLQDALTVTPDELVEYMLPEEDA